MEFWVCVPSRERLFGHASGSHSVFCSFVHGSVEHLTAPRTFFHPIPTSSQSALILDIDINLDIDTHAYEQAFWVCPPLRTLMRYHGPPAPSYVLQSGLDVLPTVLCGLCCVCYCDWYPSVPFRPHPPPVIPLTVSEHLVMRREGEKIDYSLARMRRLPWVNYLLCSIIHSLQFSPSDFGAPLPRFHYRS